MAGLAVLFLLQGFNFLLAGEYSNGIYETEVFQGQATLRMEFDFGDAIPFGIEEKMEIYSGYQFPYTYLQIPPGARTTIVRFTVEGAQVTVTRSNHQFNWSSRTLITDNPFRMSTSSYYRFHLRASGHPDYHLHFALKQTELPNVEMTVTSAPSIEATSRNALIPADERFPALFTIQLWDADGYPKVPYTEPQELLVSITDSTRGRLESNSGSGREIAISSDGSGKAEFRYVYLGSVPTDGPFVERITIKCLGLYLIQTRRVSVGLKPRIVDIAKRWDSGTQLPRKVGLRIQYEDQFHPDLDYLQYNTILQTYMPDSRRLGVFLTTEWLNRPQPGNFEGLLDSLGSVSYWFRPSDVELFEGRGLFQEYKSSFLIKAIDAPWIDLEMRFPAHILNRNGVYWLTGTLGLMLEPESAGDAVELVPGSQSETLIYAIDVPPGGESVLQSAACAFQPTSTAQYWVKYIVTHDLFKTPLEIAGGPAVSIAFGTVKFLDAACDLMKGNYFNVMRDLALNYVSGLEKLQKAGKLTKREEELLFYGLIANTGKTMNDHIDNTLKHYDGRWNQPSGMMATRTAQLSEEVPGDLDLAELQQIFSESMTGLTSAFEGSETEVITVSGGAVTLNAADGPYSTESVLYSIDSEGSDIYILPANSAIVTVEQTGPVQINRFFESTPGTFSAAMYETGTDEAFSVTTLDTTTGADPTAVVDLDQDGSPDESVAPLTQTFSQTQDDGDGVPGEVEDQSPNGGDGNGDGILDRLQSNVASLPNAVDGRYVTLESLDDTSLAGVQAVDALDAEPLPENVDFPLGLFQFHLEGLESGGSASVLIHLPEETDVNSYYRFGPTPDSSIKSWYSFNFDREKGAEFRDGIIQVHFKDGELGDDIPHPDGLVVDPGGPAFVDRDHSLHFAQFAAGGGLFSEIILMNLDREREADVELNFRGDDGVPLQFQLDQVSVDGNVRISIPPSGMEVFQTDSLGAVVAGSSEATSTSELAGVLIFGGNFGLAGVGSSKAIADSFVAPMERRVDTGINTGIAVVNLESSQTTLNLTMLGGDGSKIAEAAEIIPGLGHKALFINQFNWTPEADLQDFQGLLSVGSSGRIGVTVLQTRPQQYATMPVVPVPSPEASMPLNFAQFAAGGGLFSELLLMNLEAEEAAAILSFRDDAGALLEVPLSEGSTQSQIEFVIPGSGLTNIKTIANGPLAAGSAQVDSGSSVAGVLVFGGTFGLAGVGSSEAVQQFAAPMERMTKLGISTGIAVMNLEDVPVTLDLILRDQNGTQTSAASVNLPARGHKALFVDQFSWSPAPDLSDFRGILEGSCSGRIAVTVLQTRPGQYATMPVVPLQ